MAYFYGLGQMPQNPQAPNGPFIPLGKSQGAVPTLNSSAQTLSPQAGPGFGVTNTFESAPDLVKQNILQGAGGFADPSSSLYGAYKQHALQNYNNFENKYGYGEVPYALRQNQNYSGNLFNPGSYGAGNVMGQLGMGSSKNTFAYNTIDPYSGNVLKSQDFNNDLATSKWQGERYSSALALKPWFALNNYQKQQGFAPGIEGAQGSFMGLEGGYDSFMDYLYKLAQYQRNL